MSGISKDTVLLARYAEGLFWMARYIERVENLARLIDVTQTFESPGREDEAWSALLRINADEERFLAAGGTLDPEGIKRFYLLDRSNHTSVPASIEAARTNARTLRPLISTEMWMQMNVFHRDVMAISADELTGDHLTRLCARLKEGMQAHTGITEGTFFRDQGWNFYMLGRLIERADQTTRLLDIKYHLLHLQGIEERRLAELTQWGGVLRAAAGYHAFRRVAPAGFEAADVVTFLLSDRSFPRSITLCVSQVEWHLMQLRSRYNLRGTVAALERIEEVRAALSSNSANQLIESGLHDFLDCLQRDLNLLAGEIGYAFFRDWRPEPPSQKQSLGAS
ncbi:alpha-E domain-containing protein [Acidisphaera sp. L21]|uniref:alpha-E domain-containing protein n=1 Tax=Acidisphaera sp. L21 TaxID=1641851 RepID=UPI00131A9077|nr:alpha-E domain-containing protein [Acidisphaera sp. L21]